MHTNFYLKIVSIKHTFVNKSIKTIIDIGTYTGQADSFSLTAFIMQIDISDIMSLAISELRLHFA